MTPHIPLKLKCATPSGWLPSVLKNFDLFLQDHAANEKKASAFALTMVVHYADKEELVRRFLEISKEELEHFERMVHVLFERGMTLAPDVKDIYVIRLMKAQRKDDADAYLLDRLLVGAIIEARGTERFGIVANAPEIDVSMRVLYADLQRSEARHHAMFVRVARQYYPDEVVAERLEELLVHEASVVADLPFTGRLH